MDDVLSTTLEMDRKPPSAFLFYSLPHATQRVDCAILTLTNAHTDKYNDVILSCLCGEQKTYFAADSLEEREDAIHSTDQNETLPLSTLKIGAVYRLLRTFAID
jgi:hypothetical protein